LGIYQGSNNDVFNLVGAGRSSKMVVEWKEREHDDVDALALEEEACMEALRDCGLKKFFLTSYLRAQPELLQFIVDAWDVDDQVFHLRD